jgi:membrane protein
MKRSVPLETAERQCDRGRHAELPRQIPARGWWDIAVRVKEQLADDHVSIVAAGLALYTLLSIFPALAAAVSVYGIFASPQQISEQVQAFRSLLPPDAIAIVETQLQELVSQERGALNFGVVGGVLLALWSARRGMVALMMAVNVAYNESERRSFFQRLLMSIVFTLASIVGFVLVIVLGVLVPVALKFLPLVGGSENVLLAIRWLLLWLIAAGGLTLVYRYVPHRNGARWHWVTWGSVIAATLWLAGSLLFAYYVQNFGSYGNTYGALGGVIVLLLWLFVSAYLVLLGAEINSEMERQTIADTTEGPPQPLGKRGAYSADTIGSTASWPKGSQR